jgi:hypothetical protein
MTPDQKTLAHKIAHEYFVLYKAGKKTAYPQELFRRLDQNPRLQNLLGAVYVTIQTDNYKNQIVMHNDRNGSQSTREARQKFERREYIMQGSKIATSGISGAIALNLGLKMYPNEPGKQIAFAGFVSNLVDLGMESGDVLSSRVNDLAGIYKMAESIHDESDTPSQAEGVEVHPLGNEGEKQLDGIQYQEDLAKETENLFAELDNVFSHVVSSSHIDDTSEPPIIGNEIFNVVDQTNSQSQSVQPASPLSSNSEKDENNYSKENSSNSSHINPDSDNPSNPDGGNPTNPDIAPFTSYPDEPHPNQAPNSQGNANEVIIAGEI